MDLTEKYRKMCEKATQLREKWTPQDGDFYYNKHHARVMVYPFGARNVTPKEDIPLWRQDQLLEMVNWDRFSDDPDWLKVTNIGKLQIIAREMKYKSPYKLAETNEFSVFGSLEQILFAYVMYKEYNRIWDTEKEKWIERRKS